MKLKVVSYNIHKGLNWNNSRLILAEVKQLIQTLDIDIVFFQEVAGENSKFKNKFKEYPSTSQFEYFADTVWDYYSYAQNSAYSHGHHGNLILSKFPIINWSNTNISTNRFEQRGLLHCLIEIPGTNFKIDLLCTHLNLFHNGRKKQYKMIKEFLVQNSNKDSKLILAGDFNDWNHKNSNQLADYFELSEAFYTKNSFFAKTFPSFFPLLCLDRIYTKNLKIITTEVLNNEKWKTLSDHLPILVELEIK